MNGYLLDTNIISDIMRNPAGSAAQHVERVGHQAIFTSIVVAAELRYGAAKKGSARLTAAVEAILRTIPVLPLECPADTRYGVIRAKLEAAGLSIGLNDLLIGAQALSSDLVLVTDNVREFSRIGGLAVENWLDR